MAAAFLGLDLGTTSIKVVAFDADDNELASKAKATPTRSTESGGAEYDAGALWSVAAEVLRQVNALLADDGHVAVGVATASMGEAGVLVNEDGHPVAPVIAWFDQRTGPQAHWWVDHVGAERTHRIAAVTPRAVFGAAKMLWTKEHLPMAWEAGRSWLNMADWAGFRLTGAKATDYSLASRSMLLDLERRCWSDELIDAAGLDGTKLAPLVQSGSPIGRVTQAAAAETGLPVGTVVGAGGQDHVCAALALDVTEPGMLLDSIGTAEAFFLVMDDVDSTGRLAGAGVGQGAHVEPGRTYAMTGLQQGGGRIDRARLDSGLDWESFFETPEAAAVIDAVAADGQTRIAEMLAAAQATHVRHIVTGGGSNNELLIDRKRELGGRPIEVAAQTQATALGAAQLARRAWLASK